MNGLEALADFAGGLALLLEPEVEAAAERLARDTCAVAIAGRAAPFACEVEDAARALGEGPACTAFLEGFRIHALEWDAVHEGAVVHALSAVTAATIAACRLVPARRAETLAAIVAGVEVATVLGVAATSPLRFFRPATAGAVGAAAAAGRILGLGPAAMRHAVALGVAQAAGTMQAHVEGSIALPLQVGFAARAGLTAASLAAEGLSGPEGAIDGPFGYFPLFDEGDLAPHLAGLGRRILEVSIKPWPCGRASHGVLDAIARGRAIRPDAEIVAIEARVPPLVARLVGRPWVPGMTASHARLCLSFLAALMLRDGRIDPRVFTPHAFADPALQALGTRLTLKLDDNPDANALAPQHVTLRFAGGGQQEIPLPAVLGSPQAPLSPEAHAAKIALALELGDAPATSDPLDLLFPEPA